MLEERSILGGERRRPITLREPVQPRSQGEEIALLGFHHQPFDG
jgi:hypothetical protein